jgi:hypothetical protein
MMNVLILAVDESPQSLVSSAKYNQTKYLVIVYAVANLMLLANIQLHLVNWFALIGEALKQVNLDSMP